MKHFFCKVAWHKLSLRPSICEGHGNNIFPPPPPLHACLLGKRRRRRRVPFELFGADKIRRQSNFFLKKKIHFSKMRPNFMSQQQQKNPPNQQRTVKLRRRNFVTKHQLSIQIGAKRAKTCMQCVYTCMPTELSFCISPLVVGQTF